MIYAFCFGEKRCDNIRLRQSRFLHYLLFIFVQMNKYHHTIVSRIKSVVKQTDPSAVAILYGSRATGKAKKNSDWDVLILIDKSSVSLKEEQLFRHNLYDLELETGEAISTFVYSTNDWNTRLAVTPIYEAIKQIGIIL